MLRPLPLLLAPCLGCLISLARADPPEETASPAAAPAAAKQANRTSFVSLVRARGQQTLMIDYRWKLHPDASVEVRLLPADAGAATVSPLYFVSEYLKGDVSRKVFHCLDAADTREAVESFTEDKIDFQVIGLREFAGPARGPGPCPRRAPALARQAVQARRESQGRVRAAGLLGAGRSLAEPRPAAGPVRPSGPVARLVPATPIGSCGKRRSLGRDMRTRRRAEGGRGKGEGKTKDEG